MEEREQFGQIPEQPRDQLRVGLPPSTRIELSVALRVGPRTGLIDGLGVRLDGGVASPPDCAKQVA